MAEDLPQDGGQALPSDEGQQPQDIDGGISQDSQPSLEQPDSLYQPGAGGESNPVLASDEPIHLTTVDHGEASTDQSPQTGDENTDPVLQESDFSTERAMAAAEDKLRTKAVKNRDVERSSEEELRVRDITQKLKTDHPKSMSTIGRLRLQRERDRLREAYTGPVYQRRDERDEAEETTAREFIRDFPAEANDPDKPYLSSPSERARFYDEQAARVGEWAEALHVHPLSAEFMQAYEGFTFSPNMLVRAEDSVARGEQELERLLEDDLSVSNIGGNIYAAVHGLSSDASRAEQNEMRLIMGTMGQEGLELEDQWEALRQEGESLAGRIDDFRRHLIEEVKIPELQNSIAITRKSLNDIRREVGLPVEEEPTDANQQEIA